jgi:hypothetical protein
VGGYTRTSRYFGWSERASDSPLTGFNDILIQP